MFLVLSIFFNVVSYIIYKSIAHRSHDLAWYALFVFGLILGAINVYYFTKALKTINLSVAYPVFSAGCIALMVLISYMFFRERISLLNMAGITIITIGIILATQ